MSRLTQRGKLVVQMLASLALLLVALTVFINRQTLYDYVLAWQYSPSPAIAAIGERADFSERGEFLFYASRPQLLNRVAFNDACRSSATEHSAILGCYASGQIFLFDISNEELDGIKEVTAAHEMLHAAYQRLSENERKELDQLLQQQQLGKDEERIAELLVEYDRTEPGQRMNELHSIIGSEVTSLSPGLEAYYAKYFTDRRRIVTLSEKYQSVFVALKQQQENLVSELTSLADTVEARSSAYKRSTQILEKDIADFNKEAGSGTMTRQTYNSQRSELERRQSSLESEYKAIQSLVAEYDRKRSELASINSESNALNRSINSSLSPVPGGIDG